MQRFKQALADGAVLGVRYAVAILIVLVAVSWVLGDYNIVRQRSQNGQRAFDRLMQLEQQAAKAQGK